MLFRKFLSLLRREYNGYAKRYFLVAGAGLLLSALLSLLVDFLIPFEGFWNALRSLMLIPTTLSIFALGYGSALFLHERQVATNPEWVPFRKRFSPLWRRNISLIAGALIIIFVYALGQRPGYTLFSSAFVAIVIGLFAFMRTTREEALREELSLPDSRDTRFTQHEQALRQARQRAQEQRKGGKKKTSKSFPDEE